ncbi:probable G-protein coupled receptor Mth-like 1 [Ceratitis capitata]|uniref:Putative G-protein coupled receptor Mth-like 1 n=1 Tax=Ceratitis capitata TaxID=7213 RepID=W8BGE8_CERCA|nr:probable G-protein coupled receptor Mth-like 1 [Ceratitis capitata]XP_004524944.1 probable G-protein coupled receptor Mth-like 1 [Ceratitis capitata]XP_012156953.1 probable G-protein coupled receptor Mth-like 1 [Ceratitis capitata]
MTSIQEAKICRGFLIFLIISASLQYGISTAVKNDEDGDTIIKATSNDNAAPIFQDGTATMTTALPGVPPPQVHLNKCCHFNEHMDMNKTCVMGNSKLWVPLIYRINLRRYHTPQGAKPKFMTFHENTLPVANVVTNRSMEDTAEVNHVIYEKRKCTEDELELFSAGGNWLIFSNGSLFMGERKKFIDPERYCVDRNVALVCFPQDQNALPRIKIRKCCGWNGIYDAANETCIFTGSNTNSNLIDIPELPLNASLYDTIYGFPKCHRKDVPYAIAGDWNENQMDNENGNIKLTHKLISASDYCLEHYREKDVIVSIKIFTCLHHFSSEPPANAIAAINTTTSNKVQVAALNFGIVISVVFLAATLVAGYMMPSIHHMLHWRCQIYYVFCLFVGDLILAYTQLSQSLDHGSFTCLMFASAMHFFFLSAFFWLNTMCFNIWWTFRDFRPSSLERNQELLRLRLYSAYAWGVPLLISAIALTVDHLPETQLLRPGFGERGCWFNGEHLSIFAYFFGPIGLLLCANIVLFISTTHQLTCGLWKRDDVKSTTEKTALGKVCLKLVVVMGVTWIADVISWVVGGPHSAWFFTDMINALQGVFIFVVVGCQPQVWAACKRFCCPRSRQEITNTTNGVQHSSSSQGLPSVGGYAGGEVTQNTSVNTTSIGGPSQTQTKIPMETVC